jgi:HD-like signal output (HDOD) protein
MLLRALDPEWAISGFTEPITALAAVKAHAPDLILSDQSMPEMQGSELLEEVRTLSPKTIRVIMSGYVAVDKLQVITSAHQFIAKPFDAAKLRDLIRRSFAAQEKLRDVNLLDVVTALRSIPSIPQVYQSIVAQLENDRHAVSEIAALIKQDPGLSIKVLQLANSPLFAQESLITNPEEAVLSLGTDMLAAVVLSQCLFKHYQSVTHSEMDLRKIWNHSWETGYFAQHICRERWLPPKTAEEALLAGLLHELGRFVLIDNFPDRFQAACNHARRAKTALAPQLLEEFKATPCQIAAYLLELWGMPEMVINAIAALDDPAGAKSEIFSLPTALYIADLLATRKVPPDSFPAPPWNMGYLQSVGCAADVLAWEKLSFSKGR